jgi:hypothetical protein
MSTDCHQPLGEYNRVVKDLSCEITEEIARFAKFPHDLWTFTKVGHASWPGVPVQWFWRNSRGGN